MRASQMALGGVTAALALVVMCLGGIIPVATFICPVICCLILQLIQGKLGKRTAWVWYAAVSILSVLMGPDKEAAAVFTFLGYYPIIRTSFPKNWLKWPLKLLYFNVITLVMYWLLIHLFGMVAVAKEFEELGKIMSAVTLLLGNVTFLLLDRLLAISATKMK